MQKDGHKVWGAILSSIKSQVSSSIFKTWFTGSSVLEFKASRAQKILVVAVKNSFVKEQLETKYKQTLDEVKKDAGFGDLEILLVVSQKTSKDENTPLFTGRAQAFSLNIKKADVLNPAFTFENFVVGSSNNLAYLAASQTAGNLGGIYNPLLIYGTTGVGKTHILHAIGNEALVKTIDVKILYVTSEKFTNDYIESLRNRTQQLFRQKYRQVDLLLVDDIQFFSGKESTQDEFFHCINELGLLGKQVVLACDRHPKDLGRLNDRLISRFLGGMVADIGLPDLEMKIAILRAKCKEKQVDLGDDLITFIATESAGSTRELEGILSATIAQVKISNGQFTRDEIKTFVTKNAGSKKPSFTVDDFVRAVCSHFNLDRSTIKSSSRKAHLAHARQVLMYFLRKDLGLPLESVGELLGGRDHSTVIHGVEKIEDRVASDISFRDEILRIKSLIHK